MRAIFADATMHRSINWRFSLQYRLVVHRGHIQAGTPLLATTIHTDATEATSVECRSITQANNTETDLFLAITATASIGNTVQDRKIDD